MQDNITKNTVAVERKCFLALEKSVYKQLQQNISLINSQLHAQSTHQDNHHQYNLITNETDIGMYIFI